MSLLLHCGANAVSREELMALPHPEPMGTRHNPIHHGEFMSAVEEGCAHFGMTLTNAAYGVTPDGNKFFGLADLALPGFAGSSDYSVAMGIAGSHDQSMARKLGLGSHVFVCDNLAFSADVVLKTKHTTNILDRIGHLVLDFLKTVPMKAERQEEQLLTYKATWLTDSAADAAMTQLVRMGAINPRDSLRLIKEWDEPSYEDWADEPTVWRLFNAATTVLKPTEGGQSRLPSMPARTLGLHAVCDRLSDFTAAAA